MSEKAAERKVEIQSSSFVTGVTKRAGVQVEQRLCHTQFTSAPAQPPHVGWGGQETVTLVLQQISHQCVQPFPLLGGTSCLLQCSRPLLGSPLQGRG